MEQENRFPKHLNETFKLNYKRIGELLNEKTKLQNCMSTIARFPFKLKVPIMIPLPTLNNPLALLEGTVIHPNELLVTLGDHYMCDMTVDQTKNYIKRKIDAIDVQLIKAKNEQRMIYERLAVYKESFNNFELVEEYNSDEEKQWQELHRKNVKRMKEKEAAERKVVMDDSPDKYFQRLDELEAEESQSK